MGAVSFWDILMAVTLVDLALSAAFLAQVARLARRPLGARLTALALVFLAQSLIGLVAYARWESLGYGRDVALPLLGLQVTILAGIAVLVDTTRL